MAKKRVKHTDTMFARWGSDDNFFTLKGGAARLAKAIFGPLAGQRSQGQRATIDISGWVGRGRGGSVPSLGDPPKRSARATVNISGAGRLDRKAPQLLDSGPAVGVPSLADRARARDIPSFFGVEDKPPNISGAPPLTYGFESGPFKAIGSAGVESTIDTSNLTDQQRAALNHLFWRADGVEIDGYSLRSDYAMNLSMGQLTLATLWETTLARTVLRKERELKQHNDREGKSSPFYYGIVPNY